jgi:hypothetical protein
MSAIDSRIPNPRLMQLTPRKIKPPSAIWQAAAAVVAGG